MLKSGINGQINTSNNKMKTVITLWWQQGLVLELELANACHYCSSCRIGKKSFCRFTITRLFSCIYLKHAHSLLSCDCEEK